MTDFRAFRILVILAGIMGADGVILAAVATHQGDTARLLPASSMLLFHATAVLAVVALTERGIVEIIGLCGYYTMVSMTLNTFEFELPEGQVSELV